MKDLSALLVPITSEDQANSMDQFTRTKGLDLNGAGIELKSKVKAHLEFYLEAKESESMKYYCYCCHAFINYSIVLIIYFRKSLFPLKKKQFTALTLRLR